MADKTQHDLAVEAGKTLLTESLMYTGPQLGTDANSPIGPWRDNEPIKWNKELAGWEYESDAAMLFCSRLDPTSNLTEHISREGT